jgi:riboflavin synthase
MPVKLESILSRIATGHGWSAIPPCPCLFDTIRFVFTGLIQHVGKVQSISTTSFGAKLEIDPMQWAHKPLIGESIAVDGCCLTLAERSNETAWHFDLVPQTLGATNFGSLRPEIRVNLEHSVTPNTLLGGHIVQGHIDGVGVVSKVTVDAQEHRLRVIPPIDCMCHIVRRGSIAVNGVSLTVGEVGRDWFEVALIPTTLRLTNLGDLHTGSRVNLEADYIAKIIANLVSGRSN